VVDLSARRMGEFLRIVLLYLWNKPDGATTREILAFIPNRIKLTEQEIEPFPNAPHFRFYEILVGSAMGAVMKAGWLVKENSTWFITEEGRLVCKDFGSAEAFYTESQRIFEEWRLQRSAAQVTVEEAEEKAWEQIRLYLQSLDRQEFRYLVKALLEAMDYHIIWMAPAEKTRGNIDMIACANPLGVGAPRLLVQLKHKTPPISAEGLASAISILGLSDVGLVVSSGGFTADAAELVRTHPTHGLSLMNLRKFHDMWLEYYEKIPFATRQHFPLKAVHFLSLDSNR